MSNNNENNENNDNSYIFNPNLLNDSNVTEDDFIDMPQLVPYSQITGAFQTIDIFYINNTISSSSSVTSLPNLIELNSTMSIQPTFVQSNSVQPTSSIDMSSYLFSYLNYKNSYINQLTSIATPTVSTQPTTSAYPYTTGYNQPTTSAYPYTTGYNQSTPTPTPLYSMNAHPLTTGYNQYLNTQPTPAPLYSMNAHPLTTGYNQYLNTQPTPAPLYSMNAHPLTSGNSQYSSAHPTTISTHPPIHDQFLNTTFIPTINNSNILIQPTNHLGVTGTHNVANHMGVTGTNNNISNNYNMGVTGTYDKMSHNYYMNTQKISCIYDNFSFNAITKESQRVYTLKYNDIIYEVTINVNNMSTHKDKKLQKLVSKIENILKTETDINLLSICKSILKKDSYINNLLHNRILIKI